MITTKLLKYWYPQKGIIAMVTELGEFEKFAGMVEKVDGGFIFWANHQRIFAEAN